MVAVFCILRLSQQNALLRSELDGSVGTLAGPPSAQTGDIVPTFRSVDLAGQPTELVFDGTKKSLIFVFSPACDTCMNEISTWNKIATQAASRSCLVRGISLDSLDESQERLKNQSVRFEILIMPSMSIRRAYRVVSIPQTMLLSALGTVDWVHYGALTDDAVDELLSKI